MRKIVLTYGLIAGSIMSLVLLVILGIFGCDHMESGMIIGYTTMILAFTLVFFGTRNYRDNIRNGVISFGRAFGVGLLISLVASVIYVIAWMIFQHFIMPDFYQQYANDMINTAKASGASVSELQAKQTEMNSMIEMVKNPVVVFFYTLLEPLPPGILVTLVSAFIVKKKTAPAVQ
ncbi:hypothetical protein BH11BAC7_BH11BAC7_26640 [soil metagenome]